MFRALAYSTMFPLPTNDLESWLFSHVLFREPDGFRQNGVDTAHVAGGTSTFRWGLGALSDESDTGAEMPLVPLQLRVRAMQHAFVAAFQTSHREVVAVGVALGCRVGNFISSRRHKTFLKRRSYLFRADSVVLEAKILAVGKGLNVRYG